ncbi:MAG: DUF58 domain-containing protein, partial [Janthinobacterium lividum]
AGVRRIWSVLTVRGRWLAGTGLLVLLGAMVSGQRDVMRVGLLLLALPVIALVLVLRARLRMSAERSVEPAQVALGTPMHGRIVLGHDSLLPAALLELEDQVPSELGERPRFLVDRATSHWQRTVEYPLLGRARGHYRTGPLMVRTTDPFGLVRLDRTFTATSEVVVTPQVFDLRRVTSGGSGGSAGEARPRRIGVLGADDVLVREYRQGDDVRRIHWRSTARSGELMVRREEQALDPTTRVLLDSRTSAHAGRGIHHSLEWAVSAVASVGLRLAEDGYAVDVVTSDGPLQGTGTPRGPVAADALLQQLTDLRPAAGDGLGHLLTDGGEERGEQLVVAVLGRLTPEEAYAVAGLRRRRATGLAMVLDVGTWTSGSRGDSTPDGTAARAAEILADHQWRVVVVDAATTVPEAWAALERTAVPA